MIVFVAPFPRPELVREGWMSRIAAIDRLFADRPRTYVDVVDDRSYGMATPERLSPTAEVYRLNLSLASHYDRLRRLVLGAEMVYVHTFHLARWLLPFYRTGKVVTDVHGATAEEELLYGRPACQRFYDEVEKVVMAESRHAVVVTEAMADHLRSKHPASRCEFLVLPVIEAVHETVVAERPLRVSGERPRVVYSGGPQRWQNVDLMMDVARERIDACEFTFLSNEVEAFARAARERGILDRVNIQFAPKAELPRFYQEADYGLVLRDDGVVNRVACPTKLSEYLWFGVIPVVQCAQLGDFPRLGYRWVALDEFRRGELPDTTGQLVMRRRNADIITRLRTTFEGSARRLQTLPQHLPQERWDAVPFLSDHERNVLYPATSFVQLETAAGPRQLTQQFAEPYDAVAFDLGEEPDVRRVTWMPVDRECRLVLREVRILDGGGDDIPFRMSGNHVEDGGSVLSFGERPALVHFDLDGTPAPRRFTARFDLVLVGEEVARAAGMPLPAAPLPTPVVAPAVPAATADGAPRRRPIYDALTSSPTIVKLYWRFVKPTRDRVRAARHARRRPRPA